MLNLACNGQEEEPCNSALRNSTSGASSKTIVGLNKNKKMKSIYIVYVVAIKHDYGATYFSPMTGPAIGMVECRIYESWACLLGGGNINKPGQSSTVVRSGSLHGQVVPPRVHHGLRAIRYETHSHPGLASTPPIDTLD
jgi:hypothetical protein